MNNNVSKESLEKPLLGAVLCCTSIAPEERSILAEHAQQMGAEHKLDLTSDVTHLLVGSTDTPKYQYVAREREDVKVLRPAWVQAVRQCWMEDRKIDMHALEAEHRVPAFAYLKICITGFDDLNVRAEIASAVRKHGGEYTGDLTKDVTHLIAAEPVGKKFEYATIWQKKIVSLKWYSDTIERGMQLDESKYHPSLPLDQQGIDAWNRQRQRQSVIGKRVRDATAGPEPARKLRRTASSKLSSQTDSMWGDIVGGGSNEQSNNDNRNVLRPTKSMPVMRQDNAGNVPEDDGQHMVEKHQGQSSINEKCLASTCFYLRDFDDKKRAIALSALTNLGATVYETLQDLFSNDETSSGNCFIMVPHQCRLSTLPILGRSPTQPFVVTELWLEKCIIEQALIPPSQYVLGGLVEEIRAPEITTFVVNATGFTSLETLHISKTVAMTGAKYEQVFKSECSVLVCKSGTTNQSKLFHARQWGIAVVTEKWLWKFLREGNIPAVDAFLVSFDQEDTNDLHKQFKQNRMLAKSDSVVKEINSKDADDHQWGKIRQQQAPETTKGSLSGRMDQGRTSIQINTIRNEGRDRSFTKSLGVDVDQQPQHATKKPLREISPNSPLKKVTEDYNSPEKLNDVSLDVVPDLHKLRIPNADGQSEEVHSKHSGISDSESVQSAIRDLLSIKARARSSAQNAEHGPTARNKKKLLGRALSNLSNSSRVSNPRLSRASSIDSLNTDGVGSELAPLSANSRADEDGDTGRSTGVSLLGRAQTRSTGSLQNQTSLSIDISDPNLCRDEFNEAKEEPQLTQLGYEDSEEAIALRAKLAARRKAKAKTTQQVEDTDDTDTCKPTIPDKKRVIKDDETVLALEGQSGWGGGRRTRRKEKEVTNDVF